jgi:hypothetical protein
MAAYKIAAVKVTPPNDFPLGLIRSHMVVIHLFLMLCDLQRVVRDLVRDLCPILYIMSWICWIYSVMDLLLCWCYYWAGLSCTESEWVYGCVTCCFVMLARAYSGLRSLVFCSSIYQFFACRMTPNSTLTFLYYMFLITAWYIPDFDIRVYYWECVMRKPR